MTTQLQLINIIIKSSITSTEQQNGPFTDAGTAVPRNGLSNRPTFKIRIETPRSSETAIDADV